MANPIYGKNKILLFRLLEDKATDKAAKLALQTTHKFGFTRRNSSTGTKDGSVNTPGSLAAVLDITAVASDDPVNNMLMEAVISGKKLECWEVDIGAAPTGGKYPAQYMQGTLENWDIPSDVDGVSTFTTRFNIDGKPVSGMATVEAAVLQTIEAAYAFADTVASA